MDITPISILDPEVIIISDDDMPVEVPPVSTVPPPVIPVSQIASSRASRVHRGNSVESRTGSGRRGPAAASRYGKRLLISIRVNCTKDTELPKRCQSHVLK